MAGTCPSCGKQLEPGDLFCGRCGATIPASAAATETAEHVEAAADAVFLEGRLREALQPHYLIVRRLGAGGMGSVYLAREPALKRLVAVKVLAPYLAASEVARARFQREAQSVAGLSHPNIVSIYRVGELDDGTPYFVMQYAGGESLAARLERAGPLDLAEGRRVLGQVASALAAAHAKGIIHRDIKPANVLHDDESGRVLVSDFGIAAVLPISQSSAPEQLTHTGAVVGTLHYMSPEQQLGEKITEKTDVYSLGLLGYELLGGRGSHDAADASPRAVMAAHLGRPLSEVRQDVDPELEGVIAACLNKDWEKRPGALEVARRLGAVEGSLLEWPPPGLERIHGLGWRLSRDTGLAVATVVLAVLAMLAAGPALPALGTSFATLLVVFAAFAGLVVTGVQIKRLVQTGRWGSEAVRAGYGWMTVAEVMADRRGDTGALIAGLREYAGLDSAARDRLRRNRLMGWSAFAAAVRLPLVGLFAGAVLGSLGLLSPAATFVVVPGPSLVALAVAAYAEWVETSVVGSARRRMPRRGRVVSSGGALVDPWNETFESARRGQGLGRGTRDRPWAGAVWISLGAAASTTAILLMLPLFLVGLGGRLLWPSIQPKFPNMMAKARAAGILRPYRTTADSTISALDAGGAYHTLSSIGHSGGSHLLAQRAPPRVLPQILLFASAPQGWGYPYGWGRAAADSLFFRARRGWTAGERAFVSRISASPHFEELGILARARAFDQVSARYVLPFPDSAQPSQLSLISFSAVREAGFAEVIRAAGLLAQGRNREAEAALREMISFSLLSIDESTTIIEALVATVMAENGGSGLASFYAATGRSVEAARLRAGIDSAKARFAEVARAQSGTWGLSDPLGLRHELLAAIQDTTLLRGLRWELARLVALAPCTNIRELVFGPEWDVREALAAARRSLVRSPGDAALWDLMQRSATQPLVRSDPNPAWPRYTVGAARLAGAILGNPRLAPCVGVLMQLGVE